MIRLICSHITVWMESLTSAKNNPAGCASGFGRIIGGIAARSCLRTALSWGISGNAWRAGCRPKTLTGRWIAVHADAVRMLLTLSGAQIQSLPGRLEDYNRALARESSRPPAERADERAEDALDNMEEWLGGLEAHQAPHIERLSRALPDEAPLRLQMNRERQRELVVALQSANRPAETQRLMDAWLLNPEESRPAYYRAAGARWRSATRVLLLEVDQMITPEQRAFCVRRLGEWMEDFEKMSRGG
jgi:hypothetical protein